MATLKVFEYEKCSTCKKALKFLNSKKVAFERIPIVERPPTQAELKQMLAHLGGDLRRLFNTSGQVYRELGLGRKLASMSQSEAIHLLATNGKLVKRPFVLGSSFGTVGFNESEWKKLILLKELRA